MSTKTRLKVKGYVISDQSFFPPRFVAARYVIFKAEKQTFIKASKELHQSEKTDFFIKVKKVSLSKRKKKQETQICG